MEYDTHRLQLFKKAWELLGEPCQKLLEDFHLNDLSLRSLAQGIGINEVTLRKRKQRCEEKLRELFQKRYRA